jgi:heme exporter protein A
MLTVSQLTFERYFRPVFVPLDFQLSGGSVLLIIGANGCGKTTLIRLLAGVLTATQGTIRSTARGVAYVGHTLAIKDDLSVRENVRFMRDFLGMGTNPVDEVVNQMGLSRVANQLARNLSAGQRKRCALARLLLTSADLWLLDEPYSNLDEEGVGLVDRLLRQHTASGGSCVLATHGAHRPGNADQFEIRLLSGLAGP